jgi:hypothetical protein
MPVDIPSSTSGAEAATIVPINSLDTKIKKTCYMQKANIMVLTFHNVILLSSLPHVHATHSLQAILFLSLQAQLQSTPCICCHSDSHFHCSFSTVLITLANNHLFSMVLKMSAEEIEMNYLHIIAIFFACYD